MRKLIMDEFTDGCANFFGVNTCNMEKIFPEMQIHSLRHLRRRRIHPQTHRGSALEETGRQS